MLIYYTAKTKFCVNVCKSVFVHDHAQTKKPIASKFGTEMLERVFEKISKRQTNNRSVVFLKIDLDFLEWF